MLRRKTEVLNIEYSLVVDIFQNRRRTEAYGRLQTDHMVKITL